MSPRRSHTPLDSVRRLRKQVELGAMKALADELEQEAVARRELVAVEDRLTAARGRTFAVETAATLAGRQAYLERVERELADAQARETAQHAHVEASRARLAHAARERKTVEKLDERRRAAQAAELRRIERVRSDESALLSHLRAGDAA
jgi:flagellar export protein FliJ